MTNSALVDIFDTQSFCLFRKTYNIQLHVDFPKIFSPSQSNSKEYFYKETWDFAVFSNGRSRIFNLYLPIQNKQVRLNGRRSIGSHLHLWKICGLWDLWNIINCILSVFYWESQWNVRILHFAFIAIYEHLSFLAPISLLYSATISKLDNIHMEPLYVWKYGSVTGKTTRSFSLHRVEHLWENQLKATITWWLL